jgi:hypothetical protein
MIIAINCVILVFQLGGKHNILLEANFKSGAK